MTDHHFRGPWEETKVENSGHVGRGQSGRLRWYSYSHDWSREREGKYLVVVDTVVGPVDLFGVEEENDCMLIRILSDNRSNWMSSHAGDVDGREGCRCTFSVAVDEEQRLVFVPVVVVRIVQAMVVVLAIPAAAVFGVEE